MVIISVFVAVVVEATREGHLVADQAKHINARGLDAAASLGSQLPAHLAQADQEQNPIELFSQQDRVRQHQTRRCIPEHNVVTGQGPNLIHNLLTAGGVQQLGRIGRFGACRQQIKIVANGLNEFRGFHFRIREQGGEPFALFHAEVAGLHRQPHV